MQSGEQQNNNEKKIPSQNFNSTKSNNKNIFFFLLKNPKMTMGSATKMNRLMAALNHRFNLPYRT
jgi:hypothetical protein